jgi:hypothetical protein
MLQKYPANATEGQIQVRIDDRMSFCDEIVGKGKCRLDSNGSKD